MKTISIHIIGKVQGVFYRKWAKGKADELGLKGWVRNEKNGSVYAEVSGENKTVQTFIDLCRKGPERAVVTDIEVKEISLQYFKDFRIER